MEEKKVIPIKNLIYEIRRQKVMFDSDLAKLYGVEVKRLNEAVKRNIGRFPKDFMFQLTGDEWKEFLRSQFATSKNNQGGRRYVPFVFTEQGVSMLSSVLNSEQAIKVNIEIMRAFVKLRQFVQFGTRSNEQITELSKLLMLHIDNCDYKFINYDETIEQIVEALNNLIEQPKEEKRIGFYTGE